MLPFDAPRRATLAAVTARLLPSDDGPGAAETNVAGYVETTLGEPGFQALGERIAQGLDRLDELAREAHAAAFAACSADEQDAVLRDLAGRDDAAARSFLQRLILLTLEGFLCDPARGGNRDGLGWRYIGVEPRRDGRGRGVGEGADQKEPPPP